jgi:hypothetical protein
LFDFVFQIYDGLKHVIASLILLFIYALEYAVKIQQSQGRFGLNGTNWFLDLVFDVNSLIGLDNAIKTSTEAV